MKNNVLITGVTGFVGSHLLDFLVTERPEYQLYGTVREGSSLEKIAHNLNSIKLINCDLVNSTAVLNLLKQVQPIHIYHLAGESSVKLSWDSVVSLTNNNIIGTLNLLEGLKTLDRGDTRILIACSSEEYGLVPEDNIPIKEETPLNPVSPYAVSKAAVDMFGYQYYMSHELQVIVTRAFNHTGPRRPAIYALSDFAKQIAQIEKGKKPNKLRVGNLQAVRDYTDVRDVVKAYCQAIEICEPGQVYNICSSKGYKIRDLLEILINWSKTDIEIIQERERMRPVDLPVMVGDCSKFKKATGWSPQIEIKSTLRDLLNYWRKELQ